MKKIQQGFIYLVLALIVLSCNKDYTMVYPKPEATLSRLSLKNETSIVCYNIGYLSDPNLSPVLDYGICYSSTNSNPTIEDNSSTSLMSAVTNVSSYTLTNLTKNTKYFVRAYATNKGGTAYSETKSIFTNTNIVNFSGVNWVVTELDVEKYNDGTPIEQASSASEWKSGLSYGKWCYYDFNPLNAFLGKFYNWYAVMGIYDSVSLADPKLRKTLAPLGYHVATTKDWSTLLSATNFNYLDFKIKRNGQISASGTANDALEAAYYWPASEADTETPSYYQADFYAPILMPQTTDKRRAGFSVRCIIDK